ncbi:hypothetical protein [Dyella subtropica]|uniref:hypothetical protein n=1 Tax=Dyella subtropica TaxID=2992127 RepID=UPI0022576FA4|nr:hypothetical protein [Dyella subtropica]
MNSLTTPLLALLLLPCLAACTEKKDLSPPPLNPHPKEAVRIRVDFDNPEDAKRYTVSMGALYQNQQRECGYIDHRLGGSFVYPEGTFDIPNESGGSGHAEFVVYLDRYNREECNWEFASPNIHINDSHTGWFAFSDFGSRDNLLAGTKYKETCQFVSQNPNGCWSKKPPPDVPHYSRVPITIHVSEDSAPMHAHKPGYYSHFLPPTNPEPLPDNGPASGN